MEELPIPSDEAENFYCDLYSISARLTDAKNTYKALYVITQELESPSRKDRITRAGSLRSVFADLENEMSQLMERLNALLCPPKYNIFTGEPEQETASENESNPATTYTITRNDLLDEISYYIRLLDDKIEAELALSPESKIKNDTLQSQSESTRTLKETESKIINDSADALDIYDPIKRGIFTTYVKALLHPSDPDNPKRLIILNNSLCFYSNGITKEIKQRKIMIAFADILKDERIVDKPPQGEDSKVSPAIPYQKYAAAFSFSLDGKIKESFKPKDIKNSATSIDQKIKQSLRKSLIIQV